MINSIMIIDIIRFITGFLILLYASYTDIKTRSASNYLWLIIGGIGGLLLILQYFIIGFGNDVIYLIFVPIIIILIYIFFQLRLIFGGADAKALMSLSILVPFFPQIDFMPILDKSFMPFPWVIFSNSIILFLIIPIFLMLFNLINKNIEFPFLFFGYKISLDEAKNRFVWPLEKYVNGKRRFSYIPKGFNVEKEIREFEKLGIKKIWVTPKIPFMIPLLAGFICSFIFGDLLSNLLNILLS
jgi:preflagellin peptidase FlaK